MLAGILSIQPFTDKKMEHQYLYRGVNPELHACTNGQLIPKEIGKPFQKSTYFGGDTYFGDGSVYGDSPRNAVIQHQRDSRNYPTSGVSTTPVFENAKRYATHAGKYDSGYVYKIDTDLLQSHCVSYYVVAEHAASPAIPDDEEIILVAKDFGALPPSIVLEIIEV